MLHRAQSVLGFVGRTAAEDCAGQGYARSSQLEPGEKFSFRTVPERIDPTRKDSTTWTFSLTRHGSGTSVEHSYVITKMPRAPFKAL